MTYCSRFGTFGNDLHLPSGDKFSSRLVFGMLFAPADAVPVGGFIKKMIGYTMAGYNEKIKNFKTAKQSMFSIVMAG